MIWINITAAVLKTGKAAALVEAYATAALGAGQTDPTAEVIASVSDRIRTEVQSCSKNRISATAGAIPPSLKSLAIRMIIWELQSRLNVLNSLPMSDQDQSDHRDDVRYLERIARCEVVIETPDDPMPVANVQSGGYVETVQEGSSGNSREELSRL